MTIIGRYIIHTTIMKNQKHLIDTAMLQAVQKAITGNLVLNIVFCGILNLKEIIKDLNTNKIPIT